MHMYTVISYFSGLVTYYIKSLFSLSFVLKRTGKLRIFKELHFESLVFGANGTEKLIFCYVCI